MKLSNGKVIFEVSDPVQADAFKKNGYKEVKEDNQKGGGKVGRTKQQ